MTGKLALSLLLALASTVALNWGFYRQHEQASTLLPLSLRRPLHSLRLLLSNLRWLVGFLVGIGGWIFYVAALAFGPLSLVQAVSAGGIGVLALLVWRWGDLALAPREWIGVGISIGLDRFRRATSRLLDTRRLRALACSRRAGAGGSQIAPRRPSLYASPLTPSLASTRTRASV